MKSGVRAAMLIGAVCVGLTMPAQRPMTSPLTVNKASVDGDGRVRLQWSKQPEQLMPRDRGGYCEGTTDCEDAGAAQLAVSGNRRSVGWAAEYNGCCQSYPIPMVLVIARNGSVVKRIQRARPIFQWQFEDGDARVAVFSDTIHGNMAPECALYDTQTWKVIDSWRRGKSATLPDWAKAFADAVGPTTEAGAPKVGPPQL